MGLKYYPCFLIFLLLMILFTSSITTAQEQLEVEWGKSIDIIKDKSIKEFPSFIQNTRDNGYVIGGSADTRKWINVSFIQKGNVTIDQTNIFLLKVDSQGKEQWKTFLGGDKSSFGFHGIETQDGGFVVTGASSSFQYGEGEIYVGKTYIRGTLEWEKSYGLGTGFFIQQTPDGGYLITGSRRDPSCLIRFFAFLLKIDKDGKIKWIKNLKECPDQGEGKIIYQTSDGGYIVYIDDCSPNGYLLKFDSSLEKIWEKDVIDLGIPPYITLYYPFFMETTDKGFFFAYNNYSLSIENKSYFNFTKFTPSWNRQFVVDSKITDFKGYLKYIHQTEDGGYVFFLYNHLDQKFKEIKIDRAGRKQWESSPKELYVTDVSEAFKIYAPHSVDPKRIRYYITQLVTSSDLGYMITGNLALEHFDDKRVWGTQDILLIKLTPSRLIVSKKSPYDILSDNNIPKTTPISQYYDKKSQKTPGFVLPICCISLFVMIFVFKRGKS